MDSLNNISVSTLLSALLVNPSASATSMLAGLGVGATRKYYGFSSGRGALAMLFKAKSWKKIGLSTFTCPVIYEAIKWSGASPVLIDVDPKTWNIDLQKLSGHSDLDAIIVVHTFGLAADVDSIRNKLKRKTKIIEDCAQAIGSQYQGHTVGNRGDYALFCLSKQIFGTGGAILISNQPEDKLDLAANSQSLFDVFSSIKFVSQLRPAVDFARRLAPLPKSNDIIGKIAGLSTFNRNLFIKQKDFICDEVRKRRSLVKHYIESLDHKIFSYQSGVERNSSLFNFSVALKFGGDMERDRILLTLRRQSFFADRQWYNSHAPDGSAGKLLADRVINLPIRSAYDREQIEKGIHLLNDLGRAGRHD